MLGGGTSTLGCSLLGSYTSVVVLDHMLTRCYAPLVVVMLMPIQPVLAGALLTHMLTVGVGRSVYSWPQCSEIFLFQ